MRILARIVAAVVVLVILVAAAAAIAGPAISRIARARIVSTLDEHFASEVRIGTFKLTLFPSITAIAEDIVFQKKDAGTAPPLIQIRRLSAHANFLKLIAGHVSLVNVEGLNIQVTPRGPEQKTPRNPSNPSKTFVVDELTADGAKLTVFPRDPSKEPLEFDIQKLQVEKASAATAMPFHAVLRNAKPPGLVDSDGSFGPWNKEDPGETPVAGKYIFRDADLGVFKGIAGTLASDGTYRGILQRIEADGTTDVPNFTVLTSGNPIHLTTHFHAIIDGTNGSTALQPVTAEFGHSSVTANGGVEGAKGQGKTVSLDVVVNQGRLEDMLTLAMNSKTAMMSGAIAFHAKLRIPPGPQMISEKIDIVGVFNASDAQFSNSDVQEKMNDISHRGKGQPKDPETDSVVSHFKGPFSVRNGLLTIQNVTFDIPGVDVSVNGNYTLVQHEMDFHCDARLRAKLSQTTTGFTSFLLKALDPFFKKKNAGAEIAFSVKGDPSHPLVGLDVIHH